MANRYRYPGSRPFSFEDQALFFGRDKDINEVRKYINVEKLVVLYGRSGLGKSSLINAGVIPLLNDEKQYLPINIRFKNHHPNSEYKPLEIFQYQVEKACENYKTQDFYHPEKDFLSLIQSDEETLWQELKGLQIGDEHNRTILFIFDQFEELFTYPVGIEYFSKLLADSLNQIIPRSFKRSFKKKLWENPDLLTEEQLYELDNPVRIKVLISIRSDKLNLLNRLSQEIPIILSNCYELGAMTREKATTAIIRPARKKGEFESPVFHYSPESLENILDYLTQFGEKDIEPFQLQILCQHVEEDIVIGRDDDFVEPEDIGDLRRIYQNYYDNQILTLDSEEEQHAARLLVEDGLIFEEELRRVNLNEVQIAKLYDIDKTLLQKLVDSHLLRAEPSPLGGFNYELSHDSLVAPILKSKEKRIAEENFLKQQEEMKLKLVVEQNQRAILRKRIFTWGLVGLVLIAGLIVGNIVFSSLYRAKVNLLNDLSNQKYADSLITVSLQTAKSDPTKAIWLAQEGLLRSEDNAGLILVRNENLNQNIFYESIWPFHDGDIHQIVFSEEAQILLSGSADNTAIIWDTKGKIIKKLDHPTGVNNVNAVAISPKGNLLVTAADNGQIFFWDKNGKQLLQQNLYAGGDPIKAIVFSSDGKLLACAGADRNIIVWDVEKERPKESIRTNHNGYIHSLAFSPNGRLLASGGSDGHLKFWNLNQATPLIQFEKNLNSRVNAIQFSQNGKQILLGLENRLAVLWEFDGNRLREKLVLKGHTASVNDVEFINDDAQFLTCGDDKTSIIWNRNGIIQHQLRGHTESVYSVQFNAKSNTIYSAGQDDDVFIWNLNQFKKQVWQASNSTISALTSSEDGIIIGNNQGEISIWNSSDDKNNLISNGASILALSISGDNKYLAFINSEKELLIWNIVQKSMNTIKVSEESLIDIAFIPNTNNILVADENSLYLYDEKGNQLKTLAQKHQGNINDVAVSGDGEKIIFSVNQDLKLMNADFSDEVINLKGKIDAASVLTLNTDGTQVLVSYSDNPTNVFMFNTENANNINKSNEIVLQGHSSDVIDVKYSPNDSLIVTIGKDEAVKVWNTKGQQIQTYPEQESRPLQSSFSPDGKFIIVTYEDGTVIQWYLLPTFLTEGPILGMSFETKK